MIESNAFLPVLTDYLGSLPDTSLPVPSSGSHSLLGLVFRKPREPFGPVKRFLVHLYLKTEKCIRLKLLV